MRGAKARDQPDELLRFRLGGFGGMGAEGGKGRYHNPMEKVVRPESLDLSGDEAEQDGDVEMEDAQAAPAVKKEGEDKEEEEDKRKKKERKEKKERRKSEAAAAGGEDAAESPKKKKKRVKAEE